MGMLVTAVVYSSGTNHDLDHLDPNLPLWDVVHDLCTVLPGYVVIRTKWRW